MVGVRTMINEINSLIREAQKEIAELPLFPLKKTTQATIDLYDWIETLILIRDRLRFENE
jgi:hypothetical protein